LLAYYPMDSLAGSVLVDASGYGHDGTCTPPACPTVVADHTGDGSARQFDGSATLVTIPASATFDPATGLTVAAWIDPATVTSNGSVFQCFFNRQLGSAGANSWQLCIQGNRLNASAGSGSSSSVVGPTDLVAGSWRHAAFTVGSNGAITLYEDASTANTTGGSTPLPIVYDGDPATIGMDLDSGSQTAKFGGALDELRVYNRALSQSEIAALMN
jgi:hypothetical protein